MGSRKSLQRVNNGKVFFGVCNGIAEYTNIDVKLVRVIYIIVSIFWFLPIFIYIVLIFALPIKEIEIIKAEIIEDEYAYNQDDYKL